MPKVVETDGDCAVALTECRVEIHAQADDVGTFDRGCDDYVEPPLASPFPA